MLTSTSRAARRGRPGPRGVEISQSLPEVVRRRSRSEETRNGSVRFPSPPLGERVRVREERSTPLHPHPNPLSPWKGESSAGAASVALAAAAVFTDQG